MMQLLNHFSKTDNLFLKQSADFVIMPHEICGIF